MITALYTNATAHEVNRDLEQLQAWAAEIMASRPPDVVIGDGSGEDYMHRWFVIPRNVFGGVYIHRFLRSDKDVPHDHPWDSQTIVLEGEYLEHYKSRLYPHTPVSTMRYTGQTVHRAAEDAHRVELVSGPATTLFIMGPRRRQWGFHCPNGWVQWDQFVDSRDKGQVGRGCGED